MRELRDILHAFSMARETLALATVVNTQGSSYRSVGARMLVLPGHQQVGKLSGGCIEDEVALRAQPVIQSGNPVLFSVDTLRRFGCPGSLEIFVERIEPGNEFLTHLGNCVVARVPAKILVIYEGPQKLGSYPRSNAPLAAEGFEQLIDVPIRVVVTGNGADTDALLNFSKILGWDARALGPHEALETYADMRTALIIKNHHFGRDATALEEALRVPFGYVGLLGSRKRKQQILNTLADEYFLEESGRLDHFHGPAGLDLGAESPEEIALSIVAEIQAVMNGRAGGFLRDRKGNIHQRNPCPVAVS